MVKGDTCARTANELLKAFRRLGPKACDINIPVYVGHGEIHCYAARYCGVCYPALPTRLVICSSLLLTLLPTCSFLRDCRPLHQHRGVATLCEERLQPRCHHA